MWFDFTVKGKSAYINSDVIVSILEAENNRTEIVFSSGGGVIVDQPISEVVATMFEKVDEPTEECKDYCEVNYDG